MTKILNNNSTYTVYSKKNCSFCDRAIILLQDRDHHVVIKKIDEEIDELKRSKVSQKKEDISEEIGDLFFTLVNLSRHYNLEPEDIIRKANLKFETRFRKMEDEANKTKVNLEDLEINELETLWQKIK